MDNGMVVIGVENPALHYLVCDVRAHAGPRFERSEESGLTHFLEHMLTQGSGKFPDSNILMRAVEDLGGMLDATTHPEWVELSLGVHSKHWRRGLEILSDMLLDPLFDEREIEDEKRIVAQELAEYRDQHQRNISAAELAYTLLLRDEPDELGTRGSLATLQSFDRDMVRAHYERYVVPQNMVVALAGAFEFEDVFQALASSLGTMQGGDGRPQIIPPQAGSRRARSVYRITERHPMVDVELCHPAYGLGDERYETFRAAGHILGGGLSSRLFTHVREELGLVYHIASFSDAYSDTGAVLTSLSVDCANLPAAVQATLDVTEAFMREGATEQELERHKETVRCGVEIMCDRPHSLAAWFGQQELLLRPERLRTPEEQIARVEDITPDALHQVMGEVFDRAGAGMAVVGPFGEQEKERLRETFPAREHPGE